MSDTPNLAAINAAIDKLKSIPPMNPEESGHEIIRSHMTDTPCDTIHTLEEFPSKGGIMIIRHAKWRKKRDANGDMRWRFEQFDK